MNASCKTTGRNLAGRVREKQHLGGMAFSLAQDWLVGRWMTDCIVMNWGGAEREEGGQKRTPAANPTYLPSSGGSLVR